MSNNLTYNNMLCALADALLMQLLRHQPAGAEFARPPALAIPFEKTFDDNAGGKVCTDEFGENMQAGFASLWRQKQAPEIHFCNICDAFGLSLVGQIALLLAICPQLDRRFEQMFARLNCNRAATAPSLGVVISASGLLGCEADETAKYLYNRTTMRRLFNISSEEQLSPATQLLPQAALVAAFHGVGELNETLKGFCVVYRPSQSMLQPVFAKEFIEELAVLAAHAMAQQSVAAHVVLLVGNKGAGRRFAIRQVAAQFQLHLLCVNLEHLAAKSEAQLMHCLDALEREMLLHPAFLAFTACSGNLSQNTVAQILERATCFSPFVWVLSNEEGRFVARSADVLLYEREVPRPSYSESEQLFMQMSENFNFAPAVSIQGMVRGYRMLPGEIWKALESAQLSAYARSVQEIEVCDLTKGMAMQRSNKTENLGIIVTPYYNWDSFITTDDNVSLMKLAVYHLRYRSVVGEQWGFDVRNAYGRGVCVLLYGPPGTGKTMAAHVMAAEAGLSLYKVDGSQLISKYIGETSKNIGELFAQAQNSNTVLFFDEADGLFGKRSQVNDSNDRHANNDTAFLLQKIEEYDGMTILATNLASNIDDAFRRRITYAINLSMPDVIEREKLWRHIIHKDIPAGKIDYEFLSKFELAGSSIKSIVLSACYMAAAKEEKLTMAFLTRALRYFMAKNGKNLNRSELVPYNEL